MIEVILSALKDVTAPQMKGTNWMVVSATLLWARCLLPFCLLTISHSNYTFSKNNGLNNDKPTDIHQFSPHFILIWAIIVLTRLFLQHDVEYTII